MEGMQETTRRGDKEFQQLVTKWESSARRAFLDAEAEQDLMGRQLIEHGAMCYFNCASDLRRVLASLLLGPLATPREDRR